MSVISVSSVEEYNKILADNKVVVVDFYADWCGPCKMIAPKFAVFAESYPSAKFIKVNIDHLETVAESENVTSMPTFKVFRDGKIEKLVVGANIDKVRVSVEEVLSGAGLNASATVPTPAPTTSTPVDTPVTTSDPVPSNVVPAGSKTAEGMITITSEDQYNTLIQKPYALGYFSATWCGPCKMIAPKLPELLTKFPEVPILKVDADEFSDLAETVGASSLPSFFMYHKGKVVGQVFGANLPKVEAAITKALQGKEDEDNSNIRKGVSINEQVNVVSHAKTTGINVGRQYEEDSTYNTPPKIAIPSVSDDYKQLKTTLTATPHTVLYFSNSSSPSSPSSSSNSLSYSEVQVITAKHSGNKPIQAIDIDTTKKPALQEEYGILDRNLPVCKLLYRGVVFKTLNECTLDLLDKNMVEFASL